MTKFAVLCLALALSVPANAFLKLNGQDSGKACLAQDLQNRIKLQNKLAGECEEMCKETGFYPDCSACPGFVPPDPTPGVMTWEELWTHMDNLVAWSKGQLKEWHSEARGGKAPESMEEAAR